MGRGLAQKTLDLYDAIKQILIVNQPTTVRSVCYQLFIKKLIKNMNKSEVNRIGYHIVNARETNVIPWDWIVDEHKDVNVSNVWDSIEQKMESSVLTYRRDHWQEQENWIEIWSEKGTVRGVIWPVINKYGVTLRVMHGYASATGVHEVARKSAISSRSLTALYVGDYDPSGLHMSEVDLPGRLERYSGDVVIKRIALLPSDLSSLPSFSADEKKSDSRYNWYTENYGNLCWELDALQSSILRRRVESEIKKYINIDA